MAEVFLHKCLSFTEQGRSDAVSQQARGLGLCPVEDMVQAALGTAESWHITKGEFVSNGSQGECLDVLAEWAKWAGHLA